MFSKIKLLKVISIILTLVFIACCIWITGDFFSGNNDLNYFKEKENGSGFFVVVVVLAIVVSFVFQSVVLSKIQKELEQEKIAVAEEIKELKKQIEKLQK